MKAKRITSLILALALALSLCLTGCGSQGGDTQEPAGVPAICGEEGICSGCGVATLSISYYDLSKTTGQMAARILTGEADISAMPIKYTTATPKYNPTICEALGITPLDGYTAIED